MRFEQALQAMREGKTCEIWDRRYKLQKNHEDLDGEPYLEFIYRTSNISWILGYPDEDEILAEDWVVVNDK